MISSFSGFQGNCIDVTSAGRDLIEIVETENPDGPIVTTNKSNFRAFIQGIKAGEFDHFVEEEKTQTNYTGDYENSYSVTELLSGE